MTTREAPQDESLAEASSLIRSGQSAQAIPLLDSVIQAGNSSLWALEERGRAKQFIGDLEGALADFTTVVDRWPNETRGFTSRAEARRLAGDLGGAVTDYTNAIAIDPEHPFAFLQRGRIRAQLGDLAAAITDFTADMDRSRTGPLSGLLNRGEAKHLMGDFSAAIGDLTAALEVETPPPIWAPLLRGRAKSDSGDHDGAIADFTLAIEGFPGLTNAFRHRAEARRAIGDTAGALADTAEYERLGGTDLPAYSSELVSNVPYNKAMKSDVE